MTGPLVTLARATAFAAAKHARQRRKGDRKEPYFNHLAEVAQLLAEATEGRDADLVVAGLLHDCIEDGHATREEVAALFGSDVASLVMEVTDDPALSDEERKRRQVEEAPRKSARARMLKLADKTSNLREVHRHPPRLWSRKRRRDYFEWGRRVAEGCRGVNTQLEAGFDEAYRCGMAEIDRKETGQ